MKRYYLLTLLLLTGCQKNVVVEEPTVTPLDYDITIEDTIKWSDLFLQEEERYLVYVYSETCGYCKMIKQDVLSYYLLNKDRMYFVCSSKDEVPFDITKDIPIGISTVENLYLRGTPTMLEVENKCLSKVYEGSESIKNYIEENKII